MKSESVSFAKITSPKFSGVFQRKRLFTLLDRCCNKPAIWITGPPGAGKTILVSSYLEARRLPCIWYQIDSGDEDIATFFYYMGIAAKRASPRRRPLPLFTQEYIPGLAAFTRRYFEELYIRLKSPFCIVFDNYHDVKADALLHDVIRNSIEAIPEGVNFIFISRAELPGAFANMQADNLIEVIGSKDLCLTPEEYTGIVRLKNKDKKYHIPNKKADELAYEAYSKTKGWAAGLALMLEAVRNGAFEYKQLMSIGTDAVFGYFASEILERLDPDTRKFLLKSAILPVMNPQMAGELTDISSAGRILSDLSRNNCFTEKHLHPNPVYQYHPLFREFLISKAKESFGDEEFYKLQKKAALILYEAKRLEDAFELFRDCSEWEGIARLVMGHASEFIKQGRGKVLEEWITSLPEHALNSHPWLIYWLGICRMPVNLAESRIYLEKAFNLFKEQKDAAGTYLSWSGIVNSLTLALEDLKPLDIYIPMLDELMRSFGEFPSEEIGSRAASSMFMALVYRQPQHPEIDSWGQKALALSEKCGEMGLKAQTLSAYAFNKIMSGRFKEAAIAIESNCPMKQSKEAPPLFMLMMKWVEAIFLTATASHERCLKATDEGLRLSASSGVYILDILLMGHGTLSSLSAGDFKTAERFLKKMTPFFDRMRSSDKGFYHFLWGYYFLHKQDIKQAEIHADHALKYALDTGFLVAEEFARLEKAHVLHELKEYDKAMYYLKECQRKAQYIKYRHMEFISLLTEAQFAFDNGNEEAGLALLRNAFAIGAKLGYVSIYLMRPDSIARLCSKALQAGIEVEYVQEMIKRRSLLLHPMPDDIENWPWAVKVFTLGRFGIVKDGKGIEFSKKAQQRPLSLLKALIALGSRDIREEELSSILWPEAEGDAAHRAFAINLHRLRAIIGEKAIRFRDGRATLNDHYCWVDTWAFERLISRSDAALKMGNKDEAIGLIEKAILLYQGQFLGHDGAAPWIVPFRERLGSKFLRYINMLSRLYEEKGDFDKAIEALRKGIEASPLSEGFYQSLMSCYQRLGRNAEAMSAYDSLKKTLSAALNIKPSQGTETIRQSIYNSISQAHSETL